MRKRILIVEDTRDIVEALTIILENMQYDVRSHEEGTGIVQVVKEYRPHVIILDALLVGVDGPSIAKLLKADTETSSIPIILMSAHPALERMAEESAVADFLPKPFSIPALLQKIERVLPPASVA